jgi:hypothetical protein
VDGLNVSALWEVVHGAIECARSGQGPTFLHARCVHFEGHFLGFQLIRIVRDPLREMPEIAVPLTQSFVRRGGATLRERMAGLKTVIAAVLSTVRDPRRDPTNDPVTRARATLQSDLTRLQELEDQIEKEVSSVLTSALVEVPS